MDPHSVDRHAHRGRAQRRRAAQHGLSRPALGQPAVSRPIVAGSADVPSAVPKYLGDWHLQAALGATSWRSVDTGTGTDLVVKVARHGSIEAQQLIASHQLLYDLRANGLTEVPTPVGQPVIFGEWVATASEFLAGDNLTEVVRSAGPFQWDVVATMLHPVAVTMATLHQRGLVHGDPSPSNILITPKGAVLLDFSCSHQDPGGPTGTPGFTAPEVIGGSPTTAASDVFGLAAVLHFAVTGHPPIEAPSTQGPSELVVPLLTAALKSEPTDRGSMADLVACLASPTATFPTVEPGGSPLTNDLDLRLLTTVDFGPRPRQAALPPPPVDLRAILTAGAALVAAIIGWRLGTSGF